MSVIVTAVLEGVLGLLLKKGRRSLSEKLKDGDVTNQQLRSWIVSEIDNVNSKLEAFARSDLKTSVSFFKEGLVFLKKVINTEHGNQRCTETGPDAVEEEAKKPGACLRVTEVTTAGVKILNLAEEMRGLNLTDLNDSGKETLSDAKKRFDDARREATKAFNNEVLSPCDRILAMAVRLMATILEKVENPVSVLEACRSGLEELHTTAMVKENFKAELNKALKVKLKMNSGERREIISLVCHINRIIYDVTLLMGKNEDLFLLPCVDIGDENVDPLRDVRVAKTLRKVKMGDCCVAWSFGQIGSSIATNTKKQFLIVHDDEVKVYDAIGTFLNSFGLPGDQDESVRNIKAVATDRADNMYVLVLVNDLIMGMYSSFIYVFNKEASFRYKFLVESEFSAETVILRDNHLLIPGVFFPAAGASETADEELKQYVAVCKMDGERIGDFSEETTGYIKDITADDNGNIMVLGDSSCVYVFANITTNDGDDEPKHDHRFNPPVAHFVYKFEVAPNALAMAFHWTTGNVITASQSPDGRSQVELYSKEGKLERNIDIELEKDDFIEAATVTLDGSICVKTSRKVLVL